MRLAVRSSTSRSGSQVTFASACLTHMVGALAFNPLELYGIGFRCEVEGLRLRGLYALSPNEIALVPDPYTALFGAVWDTAGCGGEAGEGSVAFLFGNEGLFDLGEVLAELVLPVVDGVTVTLGLSLPTTGSPALTVGWDAAF